MHSFTDSAGRVWEVSINVAAVKRCRGLLKLDLYGLVEDFAKPLGELLGDPCRLVDAIYVLCQEQAEKAKVSDEDFGRSMGGDALEQAGEAFVEELITFFPNPAARRSLQKLVNKGKETAVLVGTEMESRVDRIDPAAEAKRLIASFGNAPDRSESTPAPSRSANSS